MEFKVFRRKLTVLHIFALAHRDTFKIPSTSHTKVKPITQISSRADQTADFSDWKPLFSNQYYRIRAGGVHCTALSKLVLGAILGARASIGAD
jgi:hypothetical protein